MNLNDFVIESKGRFYQITFEGVSDEPNFDEVMEMLVAFPNLKIVLYSPILVFDEELTLCSECDDEDDIFNGEMGIHNLVKRTYKKFKSKYNTKELNIGGFSIIVDGKINIDDLYT